MRHVDRLLHKSAGRENSFVVYIKKGNSGMNKFINQTNIKYYVVDDIGRCDYSFFHHIIKNYDNLADYTIFTKSNYYDDFDLNYDFAFDNCKNYDYIVVLIENYCYYCYYFYIIIKYLHYFIILLMLLLLEIFNGFVVVVVVFNVCFCF